jgi:hypothetical protein
MCPSTSAATTQQASVIAVFAEKRVAAMDVDAASDPKDSTLI